MSIAYSRRLSALIPLVAAALAFSAPVFATSFTVHGWEVGERITLNSSSTTTRQVWTAQLNVTLENGPAHTAAYCVDLDTDISRGVYGTRAMLNPYTSPSPSDEAPRDLAWAGHVMNNYGYNVDLLAGTRVARSQAITGVQAAI